MNKVIFADNTEYDCVFCGLATVGILFITLAGVSTAEAAVVFSDKDKVSKIRYVGSDGNEVVFEHYIKFEYIVNEPTGGVRGALRQQYASEVQNDG